MARYDYQFASTQTRPTLTSIQAGALLLETDTGNVWRWTGTTWVFETASGYNVGTSLTHFLFAATAGATLTGTGQVISSAAGWGRVVIRANETLSAASAVCASWSESTGDTATVISTLASYVGAYNAATGSRDGTAIATCEHITSDTQALVINASPGKTVKTVAVQGTGGTAVKVSAKTESKA